jgi:hypothetical protein
MDRACQRSRAATLEGKIMPWDLRDAHLAIAVQPLP